MNSKHWSEREIKDMEQAIFELEQVVYTETFYTFVHPSKTSVCSQQKRGRNKPRKRPFLQVNDFTRFKGSR